MALALRRISLFSSLVALPRSCLPPSPARRSVQKPFPSPSAAAPSPGSFVASRLAPAPSTSLRSVPKPLRRVVRPSGSSSDLPLVPRPRGRKVQKMERTMPRNRAEDGKDENNYDWHFRLSTPDPRFALDYFNKRNKGGVQYTIHKMVENNYKEVCKNNTCDAIHLLHFQARANSVDHTSISHFIARIHVMGVTSKCHVTDCELLTDPPKSGTSILDEYPFGCHICGIKHEDTFRMPMPYGTPNREIKEKPKEMTRKFLVYGNFERYKITNGIDDIIVSLNKAEVPDKDVVEVVIHRGQGFCPLLQPHVLLRRDFYRASLIYQSGFASGNRWTTMRIPWFVVDQSQIEFLGDEVAYALAIGLKVIVCVGETLEQHEAGTTLAVVSEQIRAIAAKISYWDNVVLAYVPVWAIASVKVAEPVRPQEVHAFLRKCIQDNVSAEVAAFIRIIYGGFVNGQNCRELAAQPDIDGFFISDALPLDVFILSRPCLFPLSLNPFHSLSQSCLPLCLLSTPVLPMLIACAALELCNCVQPSSMLLPFCKSQE